MDGRFAEFPAKCMRQIIFIHVCQLRKLVQIQILLKMIVDIPAHQPALAADAGTGGLCAQRQRPLPSQPQQHHLQQAAAHLLAAWLPLPRLADHQLQTVHQLLPAAVQMKHCVTVRTAQNLHTLHAQHDILQRIFRLAQLGMQYIGVDHDQIMQRNGELLALRVKTAVALGDKKQLRTAVRMRIGIPFLGIPILKNIAQPQRIAVGKRRDRKGKAVLIAAHRAPSMLCSENARRLFPGQRNFTKKTFQSFFILLYPAFQHLASFLFSLFSFSFFILKRP